jgi:HK97 gp10 family phage protein
VASLQITIEGTEALARQLGALDGNAGRTILRRATMAGAQIVVKAAQSNAPVRTGTLRRSIHAVETASSRLAAEVTVGTNVTYGRMVEEGTRPHVIYPRDKQALFWKDALHPVRRVQHPGTPAQPFLVPALENNAARVEGEIRDAIEQLLSRG